ncbi:hypothetical protein B0H17DRAFT_1144327 [Mycena rosella]|uniref:Uncharacterized protein n=1 Tax=Mycena rosella TaxID=1033263 RepID=A0AAD7CT81_MYCRO|nr:hypothetical protein B0H17DRAFT_1144327 [Mycena rosella]
MGNSKKASGPYSSAPGGADPVATAFAAVLPPGSYKHGLLSNLVGMGEWVYLAGARMGGVEDTRGGVRRQQDTHIGRYTSTMLMQVRAASGLGTLWVLHHHTTGESRCIQHPTTNNQLVTFLGPGEWQRDEEKKRQESLGLVITSALGGGCNRGQEIRVEGRITAGQQRVATNQCLALLDPHCHSTCALRTDHRATLVSLGLAPGSMLIFCRA